MRPPTPIPRRRPGSPLLKSPAMARSRAADERRRPALPALRHDAEPPGRVRGLRRGAGQELVPQPSWRPLAGRTRVRGVRGAGAARARGALAPPAARAAPTARAAPADAYAPAARPRADRALVAVPDAPAPRG